MSALSRLWGLRNERPRFVLLSLGVLTFFLLYPFLDLHLRWLKTIGAPGFERVTPFTYNDFSAFTTAVDRWYKGEPIYWKDDGSFHGSYLYPPAYLLVFVPFYHAQWWGFLTAIPFVEGMAGGKFTFEGAAVLWELFSLLLLWVGMQLVIHECDLELAVYERVGLLWLLMAFQPMLYSFKWAQTGGFQAGLICLAFFGMSRGRNHDPKGRLANLASGLFTTLASGMKPFYATSGAHLLRNRYRFLGAMTGGVVLLGLSVWVGVEHVFRYVDVLMWGKGSRKPLPPSAFWLPTYYQPLQVVAGYSRDLANAVRVVGVLAVIALSLAARNRDVRRETFALGVASIPFFAPTANTYDLVALLPVVVVLTAVEFERDGRPWLPVLAVWLLGIQAYGTKLVVDHLPPWLPGRSLFVDASAVLQPGLWGNLILIGLAGYSLAAAAPSVPVGSRSETGVRPGRDVATDGAEPRVDDPDGDDATGRADDARAAGPPGDGSDDGSDADGEKDEIDDSEKDDSDGGSDTGPSGEASDGASASDDPGPEPRDDDTGTGSPPDEEREPDDSDSDDEGTGDEADGGPEPDSDDESDPDDADGEPATDEEDTGDDGS